MSDALPPPPIDPDVDLTGYGFMPLYGDRLLSSDFNGGSNDAEWRAAVTLWWSAWKQVPAGSLPDDERTLTVLAGLGRDIRTFRRVRERALWGFTKCSDGRLYHAVLCDIAKSSFDRKLNRKDQTEAARRAKEERRQTQQQGLLQGLDPPVTESNRQGQGHRQGEGKEKDGPPALPDWLPLEPWKAFCEMRVRIRKPMTNYAMRLLLGKLDRLMHDGCDPGAVLDQSTFASWQDVYALKAQGGAGRGPGKQAGLEESNKETAHRWAVQEEPKK